VADPSETTQVSLEPREPEATELLGAVRALSAQVGGLQAELRSLRAETRPLPSSGADTPGWEDGGGAPTRRESSPWVRSLDVPASRPPAVPRLLLEIVFLAAVALAAAIAELDPVVIGLLMAGAWALVVLAEWLATRAAARHAEFLQAPFAHTVFADDRSWFAPPLERTGLEPGETAVPDETRTDGEDTAEKLPPTPSA
jgi:hypothetical protein